MKNNGIINITMTMVAIILWALTLFGLPIYMPIIVNIIQVTFGLSIMNGLIDFDGDDEVKSVTNSSVTRSPSLKEVRRRKLNRLWSK